jgi:hypothetical protein
MRTLTFDEINDLEHGEAVPAFEGRITKVYEQKTGEGQYGTWHLQNIVVSDDDGTDLSVTWGGADGLDDMKGQVLRFESVQTKHGMRGVTRDVRTHKGKVYAGVKLTDTCKIKPAGASEEATEKEVREIFDAPKEKKEDASLATQTVFDKKETLRELREKIKAEERKDESPTKIVCERLVQTGKAYSLCLDAAMVVKRRFEKKYATSMEPAQFQVMTSSFFIDLGNNNMVDELSPLAEFADEEVVKQEPVKEKKTEARLEDDEIPF